MKKKIKQIIPDNKKITENSNISNLNFKNIFKFAWINAFNKRKNIHRNFQKKK